jgi:hypothetical protein
MIAGWSAHKLAYIAFAICLLEIAIFICIAAFAKTAVSDSILLRKTTDMTWLFGGPASIGFACAGLFWDSRRGIAFIALIFAVVCWCFCSLQMLV